MATEPSQPTEPSTGGRMGEVGTTGLNLHKGGTVSEELHPHLAGMQAIKVYTEMGDNDPVVGAILYAIDRLLRGVKWTPEQGDSDEAGMEFLASCMDDMSHSWSDFISEVLSETRYGWSFHEIVYKMRKGRKKKGGWPSKHKDGKIGWARLPIRAQDTIQEWLFNEESGEITGFVQLGPPLYKRVEIPMAKALLFRTTSFKNNPEGRSLLRNAYRPWFFKNRIEVIEGVGIERDLAGFPVIHVPADYLLPGASDGEKQIVAAFESIGANIRRDKQEYLMMPMAYDGQNNPMFKFELMSAGGTRQFDTSGIINRYDQRIAMCVLADFILLGHEKVGSFALSSDKTDIFATSLGSILDSIEDVLNRFAIPRLWEINGWDAEKAPILRHGDIEDRELATLGQFLQNLTSMGMTLFPDEDLDKWIREQAHMPERGEEAIRQQQEALEMQQGMEQRQMFGGVEDDDGNIEIGEDDEFAPPGTEPGQGKPVQQPPTGAVQG